MSNEGSSIAQQYIKQKTMAKQEGINPIRGSIGKLNYYKQEGEYRVRKKPEVSPERFKTDPIFERSRASASRFGMAAQLVHSVYYCLKKEHRSRKLFNKLVGEAVRMLREELSEEDVVKRLREVIRGELMAVSCG